MAENGAGVPEIGAADGLKAHASGGVTFVDVREPDEWATGHIPGAVHVPLGTIPEAAATLPAGPLVMVCARGARSLRAAEYLASIGRTDVQNLTGGMADWAEAGNPITTG